MINHEYLIALWREKSKIFKLESRKSNKLGNQALDYYQSGKSYAYAECADELENLHKGKKHD